MQENCEDNKGLIRSRKS